MFPVAEINTPAQLSLFSSDWQALWDRTPQKSFFQTREWLECYWRRFGTDGHLRVLIVLSTTRPIGIVPLVIRRTNTALGPMRVLTYPLDGWGPFFGPLGSDPAATMFGTLQHLVNTPRDWDLLDLRGVDDEQLDKGRTANAFRLAGLPVEKREWEMNREIPIADWSAGDLFLFRRQIQDAARRLGRRADWEFVRARVQNVDPEEVASCRALFEECRRLLTEQGNTFGWLSDIYEAALCTGTADVCVLRVHGKPVAAALNTVAGDTVTPLAVSSAWGAVPQASTVCLGQMLLDSLDRGDQSYLFGPRTLAWADQCPRVDRPSHRFTHFASLRPRAQLLRLNQWRKRMSFGGANENSPRRLVGG